MKSINDAVQSGSNARVLAQALLSEYFKEKPATYPINPFQMLTDYGIPFVFRGFHDKDIEGIYLPIQDAVDVSVVGINANRIITRQRYTAAHELCHHIKDSKNRFICSSSSKNRIEKYAETFAAELLMPYSEMKRQISLHEQNGFVTFNSVLEIAEFFGVSFMSCLCRVAYTFRSVEGEVESATLIKRVNKYKPEKRRENLEYTYVSLYEQLIDAMEPWLRLSPSDIIKAKYCGNYVFNDSRLEGVDLEKGKVFEIVTDIRLHGADSMYCNEMYKDEIEVAGHAVMYEYLLGLSEDTPVDIYTLVGLHKRLYACAPYPDYGGSFRNSDPLILGSKFETVPHKLIHAEFIKLNSEIQHILYPDKRLPLSVYVKDVSKIHHRLTVIHPFGDGNGRATRAFMNLLFIRRGVLPIYIRVEDKNEYLDALYEADIKGAYEKLNIVIYKAMTRAQAELSEAFQL